jgi:hypothetical protein
LNEVMYDEGTRVPEIILAALKGNSNVESAIEAVGPPDPVSTRLAATAGRLLKNALGEEEEVRDRTIEALEKGWLVHWAMNEEENPPVWSFDYSELPDQKVLAVFVHAPKAQQCDPIGDES